MGHRFSTTGQKSLSRPPVWCRCYRRATPSNHHSTANRLHRHKSTNRFRTVTESRAAFSQAFERDPMATLLTTNKIGGRSSVVERDQAGIKWKHAQGERSEVISKSVISACER